MNIEEYWNIIKELESPVKKLLSKNTNGKVTIQERNDIFLDVVVSTANKLIADDCQLIFNTKYDLQNYVYKACFYECKYQSIRKTKKDVYKVDFVELYPPFTEQLEFEDVPTVITNEVKKVLQLTLNFIDTNFSVQDATLFELKILYGYKYKDLCVMFDMEPSECYKKVSKMKIKLVKYLKSIGYHKNFKSTLLNNKL